MTDRRARWPVVVALGAFAASLAALVVATRHAAGGEFLYALDDAYIHLSLARNFSRLGIWGVTAHGFSSSGSSLLWPMLLAATDRLSGALELAPFVLNVALGAALLVVVDRALLRLAPSFGATARAALLVAVATATPLPALVFSGMEHLLQALVVVAFAAQCAEMADRHAAAPSRRATAALAGLALLVTATRYEGFFLVAVGCVLLAWEKRLRLAITVGVAAALPATCYGFLSVRHGWAWLPDSILLKGFRPDSGSAVGLLKLAGGHALKGLLESPALFVITVGIVVAATLPAGSGRGRRFAILFLGTEALHLELASVGWFYRYEAYLVVFGLLALAGLSSASADPVEPRRFSSRWPRVAFAALLVAVLALRAVDSLVDTPRAVRDRWHKHALPAEFVARHRAGEAIVANDVGLLAWRTDANILDLYGLASFEPIRFARSVGGYGPTQVAEWVGGSGAKIAVLETGWPYIASLVPPGWIEVAEWTIPEDVVFADDRVGFFALSPEEAPRLARELAEFGRALPPDVRQHFRGRYSVEAEVPPAGSAKR